MTKRDGPPPPTERRQYYYFYGSTSDASSDAAVVANTTTTNADETRTLSPTNNNNNNPSSPSAATETDSLVGESLVPTDTEAEDAASPNKQLQGDYQQLLVTGDNGVLRPLPEHPDNDNDQNGRRRACCNNNCCDSYFCSIGQQRRFRRHPVLVVTGAILFLCLLTVFYIAIDGIPGLTSSVAESSDDPTANARREDRLFRMVFPQVDRSDYGDPVSNFIDTSLFHSSLLHANKRKSFLNNNNNNSQAQREFVFPFPTGAFWTNLVLPPTADHDLSYPIAVYPYAYKWSDTLLQVSYPAQHRKEDAKAIHDYFFPDLTFGISEQVTQRKILRFDPLSVTLRFYTDSSSSNNGYFESYLVQGSPYMTIKYQKVSPVIRAFSTFTNVICPRETTSTSSLSSLDADGSDSNRRRRLKFGVCYSNNNESSMQQQQQTTTLHGVQFIVETQEGVRWIVFSSELITLEFDTIRRTTIVASADSGEAFDGVLRLAIIPPTQQQLHGTDSVTTQTKTALDQIIGSTGMQRLIYHAGVYPVSGALSWSSRAAGTEAVPLSKSVLGTLAVSSRTASSQSSSSSRNDGRIGRVEFKFETKSFTSSSTTPQSLLMLALPHHAQSLPTSVQLAKNMFDLVFECIKGPMRPVLGSTWSYDEPLPSLGFEGDSGSNSDKIYLDPGVRSKILQSLKEDIQIALPTPTENIYGFGKQVARIAQLAHIAHVLLGNNSTASKQKKGRREPKHDTGEDLDVEISSVFEQAKSSLYAALEGFLRGKASDALVYDQNLGGMVSKDGLLNSNADFGNGRYNDHEFHYGYILLACAVMGKIDPAFVDELGAACDAIYYDVAYDTNFDSQETQALFFPGARHKVWFDGHSFASGLFPFGNGKSQESSSEAVNCYYGAMLWSLVKHGKGEDPSADISPQTDFARLLLAMEIRGARTYWHMIPPSKTTNKTDIVSVYSPEFSKNYMVGNLGMLDAVCSTWFGTEPLYVHMINLLPVTAATGELWDHEYASLEFSTVLEPLGVQNVEMAWRGYVVSTQAIIDPNQAWVEAEKLDSRTLDSGFSKSQVLYWISTRHGFSASNISDAAVPSRSSDSESGQDEKGPGSSDAACESTKACAETGLTGLCCPTEAGVFLDCCTAKR